MNQWKTPDYTEYLMGPDSYLLTKELCKQIELPEDAKILDLASGRGLSSIALAHCYPKAQIFSVDSWVSPRRNHTRFREQELSDRIIPIWGVAEDLPFAYFYFDAIFCIDGFQIFGKKPNFIDEKISMFLKQGGIVGLMMPGFTEEFISMPEPLQPFPIQDLDFYARQEWMELFRASKYLAVKRSFVFDSHDEAWNRWLDSEHPGTEKDRVLYEKGKKYINSLGFILRKEKHQVYDAE